MEQRPVVSLERDFSLWKARSAEWPVPCQDAEGAMGGCCKGVPTKGSLAFRYRTRFLGVQGVFLDAEQEMRLCPFCSCLWPSLAMWQRVTPLCLLWSSSNRLSPGCLLGLAGVLFLQTGAVTLQVGSRPRVSS